jgi:uncharacterized protein (DUF924 family)
MSTCSPADVLDFWFGPTNTVRPEWFRKDAAFDDEIRKRFGSAIEAALSDTLDWPDTLDARLARLLLLDQFTRNTLRDTPRAFAGDAKALALARRMVSEGDDQRVAPVRRGFVYLPYEHAEDLGAQREAMRLYEALGDADSLDWARKHFEIIERFGRFPHRNAVLGRASTPEEIEFLKQPGSRF